jgi:nitrous oxidase accessory protein NosD
MECKSVKIGILLLLVLMGTASANALHVDVDDGTNFTGIQAAVDVPGDSGTIDIHNDRYSENVAVNKWLPLQSEHDVVLTIVQSVLIIMVMMLLLRFMKTLYLQVFSQ